MAKKKKKEEEKKLSKFEIAMLNQNPATEQFAPKMWKDVIFEGEHTIYVVSNYGDVYNTKLKNPMKLTLNTQGYVTVNLSIKKQIHHTRVHRLVAEAFIPNIDPKNKTQVNHIDGNKLNNRANNLEWVSCQQNMDHAWENGLYQRGSGCASSKYKDDQIHAACKMLENAEYSYQQIADATGVGRDMVQRIAAGKNWGHIAEKYKIVPRNVNRSREYAKGNKASAKYSENQVREVCKLMQDGLKNVDIVKSTGMPANIVSHIRTGECWSDVSKDYSFERNSRKIKKLKAA